MPRRKSKGVEPAGNDHSEKLVGILEHLESITDKSYVVINRDSSDKDITRPLYSGRVLIEPFETLVSKQDFPDYYEVIDDPMAIDLIKEKISREEYTTAVQFRDDMILLFDNATAYNRKNSAIYKDAMILRAAFESEFKSVFGDHSGSSTAQQAAAVPEPVSVKQQCIDIITQIINYKDEEGYEPSEIFRDLPDEDEYPDYYEEIKTPIALNDMLKKAKSGLYPSISQLEHDLELMVSNAKTYNEEGSSVWDDAETILEIFDSLSKHASSSSPSAPSAEAAPAPELDDVEFLDSFSHNGKNYETGDFAYISTSQDRSNTTIVHIYNIWREKSGKKRLGFTGFWFLRPEQTLQKGTAKFYENELLKSNIQSNHFVEEVVDKAWVLFYKDYVRGKPVGCDPKHLYVCENRYTDQTKQTAKIKSWTWSLPEELKEKELNLDLYKVPLTLQRNVPLKITEEMKSTARKMKRESVSAVADEENEKVKMRRVSSSGRGVSTFPAVGSPPVSIVSGRKSVGAESSARQSVGPASVFHQPVQSPMTELARPMRTTRAAAKGRPAYFAPTPQTGVKAIPQEIVESFDAYGDYTMRWFSAPPIDLVKEESALHSLDYLYKRAQEKVAAKENTMEVDAEPQTTAQPATAPRIVATAQTASVVEAVESSLGAEESLLQVLDALTTTWLTQSKVLAGL